MPHFETDDGTRLHYDLRGSGEPTLLLIHGFASNAGHWEAFEREVERDHRTLTIDLRGHGRSDTPDGGYSIRQFTDDVAALVDSLDGRDAVVVGHSMGGTIAMQLAGRHAKLVSALVLLESATGPGIGVNELEQHDLWRALQGPGWPRPIEQFYAGFFPDDRDEALRRRVVGDAARLKQHVVLDSWRATLTADSPGIARSVKQPVLYVNGSGNDRTSADVRRILPHVMFAQVAASGHFIQLEAAEQLAVMLRRFLDRL